MTKLPRTPITKKGDNARPDSRVHRTPVPGHHPFAPARITLPRWYLQQIDEEARLLAYPRRKDVLNMLVRRKAGLGQYARSAGAPAVKMPRAGKLGPTEEYIWHIPIELKVLLDNMLDQLGGIPAKAWVVLNLHEWLGLPLNPSLRPD